MDAVATVAALLPEDVSVTYTPTSGIFEEVAYQGYTIRRHEDTTIEVLAGERNITPVLPFLRAVVGELGVSIANGNGNPLNTRQLGAKVIGAIARLNGPALAGPAAPTGIGQRLMAHPPALRSIGNSVPERRTIRTLWPA